MPSKKITPAQYEKQKAGLAADLEKRKAEGKAGKQPALSTKIKVLLAPALETIAKIANGVPEGQTLPSKTELDNAWKIVNTVMAVEKHEKEIRIKRLDLKKKMAEANDAGYGDATPEKIKEHFEAEGLQPVKSGFTYDPTWDEITDDDELSDSDDE